MLASHDSRTASSSATDPLSRVLVQAFAPLDKRALGLAVGLVAGVFLGLLTLFHLLVQPPDAPNIGLLSQYFYGYDVTVAGACIGAWWAGVAGFAAGWFFAFVRNLVVATWIFMVRTKASLAQTRDFLDHI